MWNTLKRIGNWCAASLESERLAKANGDAYNRIFELEQWSQEALDENNRLAAENAEWKAAHAYLVIDYEQVLAGLTESDAMLDKLRDLLPEGGVWCYACNRATMPIWGEEPYEHIDPKYKQMKTTFHCSICKRDTHAKDSCVDTLRAILNPPETTDEDK